MIFKYDINEKIIVKDYLKKIGIPSNVITSLKNENGQILVNDQSVLGNYEMNAGDKLEVVFPASLAGENIKSIKGDFSIIYEDSYLLVIDKKTNLASIPTRKHYTNSLANFVMSYYRRNGIQANIHFISRLDAPTSGIIMLAKNSYMLTLMQNTDIEKYYLAELKGHLENTSGTIELGIEKDPSSIIKRRITKNFINSKTIYKVWEEKMDTTIVKAKLCTGKTHQLRLHFAYLNHPIVGDLLYNNDDTSDLHLHSYKVRFIHPITKDVKEFISFPTWYNGYNHNGL